jgi:hypothetical protein
MRMLSGRLKPVAGEGGGTSDNAGREESRGSEADVRTYRPKSPLWTSRPQPSFRTIVGSVLLSAMAVAVLAILMWGWFLVVPDGQVEVVVVRVQLVTGATEDAPRTVVHVVRLPDGSQRTFSCGSLHSPGERLLVTVSRDLLTGRRYLGMPHRVLAAAPDPPPGASPFE